MRTVATILSLCLFAPLAVADAPATEPAPAWAASGGKASVEVPARCRAIAKRAEVASTSQALSARIALAGCMADAALEPLQLIDGQESVLAIETAVAPAIALLDGVVNASDASMKVIALRAKADLYAQLCTRMMNTVPPPADTSVEAAGLRETRRSIVEGMTQPWRDRAREVHEAIVELGAHHPELQQNPVVAAAIRDSERQLAQPVARR